ncbi:DNA primase, partial [Candidatus Dependentiae bacterium]
MSIFEFTKSHVDIMDVVSHYVHLKQMGNYWKGPCPFHKENDASFTISPDKQIFYCFGCHEGGDAISFISKVESVSPTEAVSMLIDRYEIEIPREISNNSSSDFVNIKKKLSHFEICKTFAQFAFKCLNANERALDYLKNRGISQKSIERFYLGLMPSGSHGIKTLIEEVRKKGFLSKDLENAGIISSSKGRYYSPFEDRLLFPIRDTAGRFIAFGGRIYKPRDTRPKYYNSKESEYFIKRQLLFGFDIARTSLKSSGKGFLVEGYLDCIAMHQNGYSGAIATLGTSCTNEHLKALGKVINTLYVVYDGDGAGHDAIIRLAEKCWLADVELYVVKLPEGQDPASLLESGKDLDSSIESSENIFTFFVKSASKNFFKTTLSEKMKVSKKIVQLISKIRDPIRRDLLLQQASQETQIPFVSLKKLCKVEKNDF